MLSSTTFFTMTLSSTTTTILQLNNIIRFPFKLNVVPSSECVGTVSVIEGLLIGFLRQYLL